MSLLACTCVPLSYCCLSFTNPLSSYPSLIFPFLFIILTSSLKCDPFTCFRRCPRHMTSSPLTISHLPPTSLMFFLPSIKPILNLFFLLLHRDVRRLVVAMSRARLGLYIFARVSLFQNCFELTPVFNQLTARPMQLHIRPHEYYSQEQPVRTHRHKTVSQSAFFFYSITFG